MFVSCGVFLVFIRTFHIITRIVFMLFEIELALFGTTQNVHQHTNTSNTHNYNKNSTEKKTEKKQLFSTRVYHSHNKDVG